MRSIIRCDFDLLESRCVFAGTLLIDAGISPGERLPHGVIASENATQWLPITAVAATPTANSAFNYARIGVGITITGYKATDKVVVVPETIDGLPVIAIAPQAFVSRIGLTSVSLPASVTQIGRGAFYSCTNLVTVAIPTGVTVIEDRTFAGCTKLSVVTIPPNATLIGAGAFYRCASLESISIPANVKSIGSSAFAGCTRLKTIAFLGDAPLVGSLTFAGDKSVITCQPGTRGWTNPFAGLPVSAGVVSVVGPAATVNAGSTAVFTVSLSAAPGNAVVKVSYATSDGTAVAGTDYTKTTGTLSFTGIEQTKTISVNTTANAPAKQPNIFSLSLTSVTGAQIGTASATASIIATPNVPPTPGGGFQITVTFPDSSLTTAQQAVFQQAAARWQQIITGDLLNVTDPSTGQIIDDLWIVATAPAIDGLNGILGQAGPTDFRAGPRGLPWKGTMEFDSADLVAMQSDGTFNKVIQHEMGHVLGFGTLWGAGFNLVNGLGTANPTYTGANALREYTSIFATPATSVPVENVGGVGSAGSHWRESVFDTELMTSLAENTGTAMPISRITVGQFADLGYVVNYAAADAYTKPVAVPLVLPSAYHATSFWSLLPGRMLLARDAGVFQKTTLLSVPTSVLSTSPSTVIADKAAYSKTAFKLTENRVRLVVQPNSCLSYKTPLVPTREVISPFASDVSRQRLFASLKLL